jgi:hypothetical protein
VKGSGETTGEFRGDAVRGCTAGRAKSASATPTPTSDSRNPAPKANRSSTPARTDGLRFMRDSVSGGTPALAASAFWLMPLAAAWLMMVLIKDCIFINNNVDLL